MAPARIKRMRLTGKHRDLFLFAAIVLFLCACSTRQTAQHTPPAPADIAAIEAGNATALRQIIVNSATQQIGQPYRWGGQTPGTGFDCSGLSLFAHQQAGIAIPRRALDQYHSGRPIRRDELKPADLVFFSNPKYSKTFHVGVYIGRDQFVHAPGKGRTVTTASLSNPYFNTNFIGAKTHIPHF